MTSTRVLDREDDYEIKGSEDEGPASPNEYERLCNANITRNHALLQPVLQAAYALNSSIVKKKRKRISDQQTVSKKPPRRSGRLTSKVYNKGSRIPLVEDKEDFEKGDSEQERDTRNQNSSDYSSRDYDERETSSKESESESGSPKRRSRYNSRKGKEKFCVQEKRSSCAAQKHSYDVQGNRGVLDSPVQGLGNHLMPPGSSRPIQTPSGWTWIPIPQSTHQSPVQGVHAGITQATVPGQWQFVPSQCNPNLSQMHIPDVNAAEDMSGSKTSSLKADSLKRRVRRENKKQANEEARRREALGMKPYAVQVKPSGIIDSGCKGHLKWQEYVRDLTPRMLDLSVTVYEEQSENSRCKLWDNLKAKFEFIDHEVTQASFDRMIKTWLRKDRERMKRYHGSNVKAPSKYTEKEWESMKKYWNSPDIKQKSERMCETRKKVVFNPRVGRHGYAGKEAKLRRERETTPGVTDLAEEIWNAQETPMTADMEKRNSTRLTAMERNQAETNRRLDDMIKSNLSLQSMLQSVLSSISSVQSSGDINLCCTNTPSVGETFGNKQDGDGGRNEVLRREGNSEQWWDKLTRASDDNVHEIEGQYKKIQIKYGVKNNEADVLKDENTESSVHVDMNMTKSHKIGKCDCSGISECDARDDRT